MTTLSLWPSVVALIGMSVVIVVAGIRLTRIADTLSERTGLGDAIGGALLLGAVTSLPGNVTVITGALEGDAGFALANPIGGIALQTSWLAIADLLYRRANLEHAAASLQNLLQTVLLMGMLAVPVVGYATPGLQLGWFHPLSLLIPVLYGYGLWLLRKMQDEPMWKPIIDEQTVVDDENDDENDEEDEGEGDSRSTSRLWGLLAAFGLVVGVAGYVVGQAGLGVASATGLDSGLVGFTLTTGISSMPELVILLSAVRMGKLTLGVGNIVGGNVYDVLMITVADLAYLDGSLYRDAGPSSLVLLGGTMLMTAVLTAGLILRDRKGIGFEGLAIPLIYLGTVALVFASG